MAQRGRRVAPDLDLTGSMKLLPCVHQQSLLLAGAAVQLACARKACSVLLSAEVPADSLCVCISSTCQNAAPCCANAEQQGRLGAHLCQQGGHEGGVVHDAVIEAVACHAAVYPRQQGLLHEQAL